VVAQDYRDSALHHRNSRHRPRLVARPYASTLINLRHGTNTQAHSASATLQKRCILCLAQVHNKARTPAPRPGAAMYTPLGGVRPWDFRDHISRYVWGLVGPCALIFDYECESAYVSFAPKATGLRRGNEMTLWAYRQASYVISHAENVISQMSPSAFHSVRVSPPSCSIICLMTLLPKP
jgi:hypothetical protein